MSRAAYWTWAGLAVLVACGGNVERGADGDGASEVPPERTPTTSNEASSDPDADTELGSCKLGRKEDYREACPWVADRRCYADREMACNCACPRSGTSQCASGFEDGPDGHVWVSCD